MGGRDIRAIPNPFSPQNAQWVRGFLPTYNFVTEAGIAMLLVKRTEKTGKSPFGKLPVDDEGNSSIQPHRFPLTAHRPKLVSFFSPCENANVGNWCYSGQRANRLPSTVVTCPFQFPDPDPDLLRLSHHILTT